MDLRVREDGFARRVLETTNRAGAPVEPTTADWLGNVKCTECGRVYDQEGVAINGPGKTLA